MRHQAINIELTRGEHGEDGLEVALLGPADKADRIIEAALFVIWLVAPGTIGTRNLKRQLFLIKITTVELQPSHTDQHNAPALPGHLRGLVHRLIRSEEH